MRWPWSKKKLYIVEMFKDVAGRWRFRIRHTNTETLATSEAYSSRGACAVSAENIAIDAGWEIVSKGEDCA